MSFCVIIMEFSRDVGFPNSGMKISSAKKSIQFKSALTIREKVIAHESQRKQKFKDSRRGVR